MSLLIAGATASLPARAGNDDEIFVGNQAAMAGGAVSATVSDSSATWYNPAGLGAVGLDQIDVSGTCYALRSYSAPGFIMSRTGEGHSASVVEFVSVPSLEYNDRHRLEAQAARTAREPDTLSLSTTLAVRYAWSRGRLNGLLVDPTNVGELGAAPGSLSVHELGLYVGGGLSF